MRGYRSISVAMLLALIGARPVLADIQGTAETDVLAQERRIAAKNKQKLVDITPYYRRLQENSERIVLILRAEKQGPESISELIQAMDSIIYWFTNKRGGSREWFVNFEWGNMAVGAQFLLHKNDSPLPFPATSDALFSKFSFTYATEEALQGFAKWCRAGGHARARRPCSEALDLADKRGLKY